MALSAAAAAVLAEEAGIDTENLAKWLHEHHQTTRRLAHIHQLQTGGDHAGSRTRVEQIRAELRRWQPHLVAGEQTAGVGDPVITRHNNRYLATGARWVTNGDCWTVTATHPDGSMSVRRHGGNGTVVLPADCGGTPSSRAAGSHPPIKSPGWRPGRPAGRSWSPSATLKPEVSTSILLSPCSSPAEL